jgi:hypothetical protein
MRERPYWDTIHSRAPIYHHLVQRGFEILYPGNVRYGARGTVDTKPLKPEHVTHLVAEANREMEEIERGFDEKSSRADGEVHVQSHARDGGKVEVADYWRAAPGTGSESEPAPGTPKARNLLDGPEDAGDSGSDGPNPPSPPKDAHIAPDVEHLVRDWSGKYVGESDECVALVKKAVPGAGPAKDWKEGEKIKGPGDPPLVPGTAIATFENEKYPNRSTGNHAAIVIGPGVKDGKEGYWVLDQSRHNPAAKSFLYFAAPSRNHTSQAENYSVIRKGP